MDREREMFFFLLKIFQKFGNTVNRYRIGEKIRKRENGVVAAGRRRGKLALERGEGIQGASCKIRSSPSALIARESWHSGTSFEP